MHCNKNRVSQMPSIHKSASSISKLQTFPHARTLIDGFTFPLSLEQGSEPASRYLPRQYFTGDHELMDMACKQPAASALPPQSSTDQPGLQDMNGAAGPAGRTALTAKSREGSPELANAICAEPFSAADRVLAPQAALETLKKSLPVPQGIPEEFWQRMRDEIIGTLDRSMRNASYPACFGNLTGNGSAVSGGGPILAAANPQYQARPPLNPSAEEATVSASMLVDTGDYEESSDDYVGQKRPRDPQRAAEALISKRARPAIGHADLQIEAQKEGLPLKVFEDRIAPEGAFSGQQS